MNHGHTLIEDIFILNPCLSVISVPIRVLFIKKPRIATDYTDGHGCFIRADPSHPCRSVFYIIKKPRIVTDYMVTDVFILSVPIRHIRAHPCSIKKPLRALR
jgi:hypothetical protein